MEWIDIEGVTRIESRARLPKDPQVAVDFFHAALRDSEIADRGTLVNRVAARTHAEVARLQGLADWLPRSRVVAWEADGALRFDPRTDLVDLTLRYAAWLSSQVVHKSQAEPSRHHAARLAELARVRMAEDPAGCVPHPSRVGTVAPTEPDAPTEAKATNDPIRAKIHGLVSALDDRFLERRSQTRMALLALLAGQHVLLLGPPGTAKSQLARSLCGAFDDARYFEYLLSRFTHPDELFGPVSIPGLKAEDYRRLTEGFLPHAHVAFLDEIFKANSAILNSLLTLINERVFHHGRHRDTVPLLGLIGASNELPDPEGGLGALFDRFLVRLSVPPVAEAENFLQIATGDLSAPALPDALSLTESERAAVLERAEAVATTPSVDEALVALWQEGVQREWQISDRRWRQAVHLLKVAAAVDGRTHLSLLDLLLLESVLAPTPDRAPEVRRCILDRLGDSGIPEHDLRAQWMLLSMDRVAGAEDSVPAHDRPWAERLAVRLRQAQRFLALHTEATHTLGRDRSAIEDVATEHLWLDRIPAALVAAHIEKSRELTRILQVAERYAEMLTSPQAAAQGLLTGLPTVARRVYGHGAVFRLIVDGQEPVGITLSGQREPTRQSDPDRVEPSTQPVPDLAVTAEALLTWLDGEADPSALMSDAPSWAGRNMSTALLGLRKLVGGRAVPRPPDLPGP